MARWAVAFAFFGLCLATMAAQTPADAGQVTLIATVTDRNGSSIPNLGRTDFTLRESGKEQNILFVEQSKSRPISFAFVLDTSVIMGSELPEAAAVIDRFVNSRGPEDDFSLTTFAGVSAVDLSQTVDPDRMTAALRRIRVSRGRALYDAIAQSVKEVQRGRNERKVIVVLTAGEDTVGRTTLNDALFAVRESDVVLYALGIGSSVTAGIGTPRRVPQTSPVPGRPGGTAEPGITLPGGIQIPFPGPARRLLPAQEVLETDRPDMVALERLAAAGSGRALLVNDALENAMELFSSEMRNQYLIGFRPDHPINDGKWHSVEIRTKNSRYEVRTRKEYFGAKDSSR